MNLFSSEVLPCFCYLEIRGKIKGKLHIIVNLGKKITHTQTRKQKNRKGKRIIKIRED